jgi:uncharacterized membrane protein
MIQRNPADPADDVKNTPSAFVRRRTPTAAAALVGLAIAFYLALYQWHAIPRVWDPVFHDPTGHYPNGSGHVLNSWVSKILPVPDAFLGAAAYAVEFVLDLIGDDHRYRTRPWAALAFSFLAMLMGLASLALLLAQPLLFHAGCLFCLCSAALSLFIAAMAFPELRATVHHIAEERHTGHSLWQSLQHHPPPIPS